MIFRGRAAKQALRTEERKAAPAPPAAPLSLALDMPGRPDLAVAARSAAANLITQHLELGGRGLAVCGVSAGVGVSYVTANLAAALAEAGVQTLVIDANLRDPAMGAYFPPGGPVVGLAQVMEDPDADTETAIVRDLRPNLSVTYAGELGPGTDPDHVLGGARFRAFVETGLREFECTLVDTPAANRSSDALLIGSLVGYALLVARESVSFADDLAFLAASLADDGVVVVGSVLNGATSRG
jgi:receptor protein-tyrosine kinase